MSFNQTQASRLKKLFSVLKLRKFLILRYQKHLGVFLDARLTFEENLKAITAKENKIKGLLRKFQNNLPTPVFNDNTQIFVRPNLDYGDVIYDKT